ncbi:MAG TPA: hypothetical protein VHM02_03060, partial [Thermoanaerobaculia bacterium]|nr:hypothetical protein [Thermoanaerobaculia bacterium]
MVQLGGERPWRSLERRAEDLAAPAADRLPERVRPELPPGADLPPDGVTRRTVLGLMGASLGLAGLTACRRPVEEIVPYVVQPEQVVPGVPRHYATTLPLGASALGVVVESHEGRPSKVEGNREHPASGGAASAWAQAAVLELYDPDRLRGVLRRAAPDAEPTPAAWGDFVAWWQERSTALAGEGGRGLWIVAGAATGPTLERLAGELAARLPEARWAVHEPAGDQTIYDGVERATGTAGRPLLDLASVRRLLALDADLFHTESEAVAHARAWTAARRAGAEAGGEAAARLYVVEPVPTSTGAVADHRLALPAGQVAAFAAAVAEELGVAPAAVSASGLPPEVRRRAAVIARDLASAPGAALVAAGRRQPPEVHALV